MICGLVFYVVVCQNSFGQGSVAVTHESVSSSQVGSSRAPVVKTSFAGPGKAMSGYYNKAATGIQSGLSSAQNFLGQASSGAKSFAKQGMQAISGLGLQISNNSYVTKAGQAIGSGAQKVSSAVTNAYNKVAQSKTVYDAKLAVSKTEKDAVRKILDEAEAVDVYDVNGKKIINKTVVAEIKLTKDLFGDAPEIDSGVRNQKKAALDLLRPKEAGLDQYTFDSRVRTKRAEYENKKVQKDIKKVDEVVESDVEKVTLVEKPESMFEKMLPQQAKELVKNNISHVVEFKAPDASGKPVTIKIDLVGLKKDLAGVRKNMEAEGADQDSLDLVGDLLDDAGYLEHNPASLPVFVENFTYLFDRATVGNSVFHAFNNLDPVLRDVVFKRSNKAAQKRFLELKSSELQKPVATNTASSKTSAPHRKVVTPEEAELMDQFDVLQDQIISKAEKMSPEQQAILSTKFGNATHGSKSLSEQVSAMNDLRNELYGFAEA